MNSKLRFAVALFLVGCAGFDRGCASSCAESYGADWVIVQYRFDGEPINCWKLRSASVTNEPTSDGIYWKDNVTGHLVHISGWYNRVQVENGNFESAAGLMGIDVNRCINGKYRAEAQQGIQRSVMEAAGEDAEVR